MATFMVFLGKKLSLKYLKWLAKWELDTSKYIKKWQEICISIFIIKTNLLSVLWFTLRWQLCKYEWIDNVNKVKWPMIIYSILNLHILTQTSPQYTWPKPLWSSLYEVVYKSLYTLSVIHSESRKIEQVTMKANFIHT